ncbi:MAG: hypothetical protein H7331_02755 [Bacteroidia bacterium]|nr:hypothetical protein [Bacteroidia bacterium]
MKKYILLSTIAVALLAGMSSCKKCTKCKVDYFTKAADGSTSYTHPQVCGDNNAVKFEEERMRNAFEVTGNVSCIRGKKE